MLKAGKTITDRFNYYDSCHMHIMSMPRLPEGRNRGIGIAIHSVGEVSMFNAAQIVCQGLDRIPNCHECHFQASGLGNLTSQGVDRVSPLQIDWSQASPILPINPALLSTICPMPGWVRKEARQKLAVIDNSLAWIKLPTFPQFVFFLSVMDLRLVFNHMTQSSTSPESVSEINEHKVPNGNKS